MTQTKNHVAVPLPVLPVRTLVLLPGVVAPIDVGRAASRKAVDAALQGDGQLIVVPQRDPEAMSVDRKNLLDVGVVAEIVQSLPVAPQRYTVVVRGERRARVADFVQLDPFFTAVPAEMPGSESTPALEALAERTRDLLGQLFTSDADDPARVRAWLDEIDDAGRLADVAATRLDLSRERMVELLSTADAGERLTSLIADLERHLEVLRIKENIRAEVVGEISKEERTDLLRQRMRAIQEELGEVDEDAELGELEDKLASAALSADARDAVKRELRRLQTMSPQSPEYSTAQTYVDWLLSLPWQVEQADEIDLKRSREILDADHEGLAKVKRRVLEYIAVRKLAPDKRAPILCLVGPPGVGKTSLGKSIASALGRAYVRVSLGGVRDESEIRGHRRTYVGALPGRIVSGLKNAGTANPVFVLDEIDKVAAGVRGDPASALLEVLDPEQNDTFTDHYIEVPIDLSRVMFICTANTLETIPGPLLDRMEVIRIPGYTDEEKRRIAREHLLPKELEEHGLQADSVGITDAALAEIIGHYTREAGVRNLRREIGSVCRHLAVQAALDDEWAGATVTADELGEILGPRRFFSEMAEHADEVGVATGMSWTPVGGEILFIETRLMPGKGNLKITGMLGDVMEESVTAAYSWVRANAERLGIDAAKFREMDAHVHVPQGAIRKDGPSAGVAITTSLVSLYTGVPVRHDVAITGEVTLRGLVLPVGGVKEKVLAAHRAGVTTIVLPQRNRKDLHDVPEHVLAALDVRSVHTVDEALSVALRKPCDPTCRPKPPPYTRGERAPSPMAAV